MASYIMRRVLLMIPLLLGISVITFTMFSLAPGDPASAMIPDEYRDEVDRETLEAMKKSYGLDKPAPVRYVLWLRTIVLDGNLGTSYRYDRPVTDIVLERLPATMLLMVTAMAIELIVGVSLGIFSALKRYSLADHILSVLAFVGVSVPGFFLAVLMIYVFGVQLRALPLGGMWTPGQPTDLNVDLLRHLIMPALTLSMLGTATYVRYSRASVLDELGADYARVARSKGLPDRVVLLRHVLPNALLPVITIFGLSMPALLGGSFFIEYVFSWPGMGLLGVEAFTNRDYPLQMGIALLGALLVLVSNLITDVAYAKVDPRITYA